MTTLTKASKTRKPARKPQRSATLGTMSNGKILLWLSEDGEVKNGYTLTALPSDFGVAFRLGKADVGGCSEEYDVLLNGRETSCTCKGNTYCGHCKHVEALQALTAAGKLPAPKSAKSEAKPEAPKPEVKKPWYSHCNDNRDVYCPHCSL